MGAMHWFWALAEPGQRTRTSVPASLQRMRADECVQPQQAASLCLL